VAQVVEAVTPNLGVGEFIGEQVAKTGLPQYIAENTSERTRRNLSEGFGMLGVVPVGGAFQAIRPTTQRFLQNMPNDLNFNPQVQFYLPKTDALKMAKERNPNLTGDALQSAAQKIQQDSRKMSQIKGLSKGVTNFIQQSLSPQGMAEWNQRGVSKTLTDLVRNGDDKLTREKWGQAAWENLTSRQFGNLDGLLKKLDNEFFTFQGVSTTPDFKKFSKLSDDDAGAFMRTIMQAQTGSTKDNKNVLLVGRQPTGRDKSGDLVNDAMNMTSVAQGLPSVFKFKKPFESADEFLDAYDSALKARRSKTTRKIPEMSVDQRRAIRLAFTDPNLKGITDPMEFRETLRRALPPEEFSQTGEFGVAKIVKSATRGANQVGFKSNDELAKALQAKFPDKKILRNSKQDKDQDVYITDSFSSDAYELGGVNVVYKVDKNGDLTAVVNDKNDIGISSSGVDVSAPGGKKLIVVTPPVTKNVLDLDQRTDYTPPPASGALKDIQEELQTPAQAGAREVYGMVGAPAAITGMALGGEEEVSLDPDQDLFGP